jgi:diketogulonate reductase-like aldo/keto reductase
MVLDPKNLQKKISLNDGQAIPCIGVGTWQLTGSTCRQVIEEALALGYCHVDTALMYENQTQIGPALKRCPREQLFVTSKLFEDLRHKAVIEGCDRCLKELGLDDLNLLLIHWPNRSIPLDETVEAFMKLKEAGKIRSFGVSNFTIHHLQDLLDIRVVPVVNQVEFHPYLNQKELLDFCQKHRIVVTAYSPLARGEVEKDSVLQAIGKTHGKKASQVALRWLLQKGMVAIPKTSHRDRLLQNGDIFDFTLSQAEMERIDGLDQKHRLVSATFSDFDY